MEDGQSSADLNLNASISRVTSMTITRAGLLADLLLPEILGCSLHLGWVDTCTSVVLCLAVKRSYNQGYLIIVIITLRYNLSS